MSEIHQLLQLFFVYLTEKFQVAAVDVDCLELFCVEWSKPYVDRN